MGVSGRPISLWFNGLHAKSGGGLTYMTNMAPLLSKDARFKLTLVLSPGIDAPAGMTALYPPRWAARLRSVVAEQIWLPMAAAKGGADIVFSPANFGPLWGPPEVLLLSNSLAAGQGAERLALWLQWKAYGIATALSLARCRGAVAVSDSIRKELAPEPMRSAIPVIHHGVSARFSPDCGERQPFLLAVGDIYIQKNFHTLIEAFALLSPRFPELELRIAGRMIDRAYGDRLKALIDMHGLGQKVRLLGHVPADALTGLYRRCRVFVFPSLAESFGMPILEAMACGAPVVASNRSAMPEVAGPAALLVDPENPGLLSMTIESVLTDDNLARHLSIAGVDWTNSKKWDEVAHVTSDFLASLAQ